MTTAHMRLTRSAGLLSVAVAALSPVPSRAAELPLPAGKTHQATAQADSYTFDPEGDVLRAKGNVQLEYRDVRLAADDVVMDFAKKRVFATGQVRVHRREGETEQVLTGDNFEYHFGERTGKLDDARVDYPPLIFRGQSLRMTGQGLIIRGATFTGCDRPAPHYRLTTDSIEIFPGDRAAARRASVWVGNRRLLTLPNFETSLKKGEKKERRSLLPKTLVNGTDLLLLQSKRELHLFPAGSPRRAELDLGVSAKQGFRGGFNVTHRAPRLNARLSLTRKSAGDDPLNSKVMLSRFPELWANANGYPLWGGRLLGDAELSLGNLREFPSNARSDRLHGVVGLSGTFDVPWTDLALCTRTYYRYSRYDLGQRYSVLGLDLAFRGDWGKIRNGEIGYLTHNIHGASPFEFDDIDIGREFRLSGEWRVSSRWHVPFRLRYDLDRQTWGNREVGLVKRAHCLEYGVTWDQARSELGLELGFIGL